MRQLILLAIVVLALIAMLWARPSRSIDDDQPRLSYIATAHQLGIVGYRDPAGVISPDGKRLAYSEGRFIRIVPIGGGAPITPPPGDAQVRFLEWTSNDTVVPVARPPASARMADGSDACVADRRIVMPCKGQKLALEPDVDVYGPIAFRGSQVYFASPSGDGMVALWSADISTKRAHRVSSFSRDAYAPSISDDGTIVFKVQSYRTNIADVAAEGGATRQLATFQSETPSYHPALSLLSFTYGTWRRVLDDGKYPDIAQEIGTIDVSKALPASQPFEDIARSDSEDQAMTWSPNGKWIAFHSHREMSDDVWLRPADASQPDKRITFLGRGAEVGWPRWSPDGKAVLVEGARKGDGRSVIYTIGVDQNSGAITSELREVPVEGFDHDVTHAEWLGNAAVIAVAKESPGHHVILTVPVSGGAPRVVHRYASEHDFSGLGVSPDGRAFAFTAPAPDGFFQIFKKAVAGDVAPIQLTTDPSNKSQPAWSPDGTRVAFTVWSYDAAFYSFHLK